jgi:hypothetical protein
MKTIHTDPEIIVFAIEDLSRPHADLNVDVEVRDEAGRWSATFFTLTNVESLLAKHARTGECAGGTYIWAVDMILVRELSERVIIETVADLRRSGEFERVFKALDADEP